MRSPNAIPRFPAARAPDLLAPLEGILRFLQADRRAAQLQLRMVSIIERRRQRMRSTNAIRKFHRAIQNTRWIVSRNDDRIAQPPQKKCFLRIRLKVRNPLVIRLQQWIEPGCEQYLLDRKSTSLNSS